MPYKDYYPVIKAKVRQEWATFWTTANDNKRSVTKDHTKPWDSSSQRNRHETLLCRLRIGHTRLTHRYLMERCYLPYCKDCWVSLSVKHFLAECPTWTDVCRHFLGTVLLNTVDTLREMIAEFPLTPYLTLLPLLPS